jgi:putative membrane protein
MVVGVVVVVLLVLALFGGWGMMGLGGFGMMGRGMMGGYGYSGWSPLGMILSWVVWALIIGGVVLLVIGLARNAGRLPAGTPSDGSVLEILKTRYAKGEINKEQFDQIKRDLGL